METLAPISPEQIAARAQMVSNIDFDFLLKAELGNKDKQDERVGSSSSSEEVRAMREAEDLGLSLSGYELVQNVFDHSPYAKGILVCGSKTTINLLEVYPWPDLKSLKQQVGDIKYVSFYNAGRDGVRPEFARSIGSEQEEGSRGFHGRGLKVVTQFYTGTISIYSTKLLENGERYTWAGQTHLVPSVPSNHLEKHLSRIRVAYSDPVPLTIVKLSEPTDEWLGNFLGLPRIFAPLSPDYNVEAGAIYYPEKKENDEVYDARISAKATSARGRLFVDGLQMRSGGRRLLFDWYADDLNKSKDLNPFNSRVLRRNFASMGFEGDLDSTMTYYLARADRQELFESLIRESSTDRGDETCWELDLNIKSKDISSRSLAAFKSAFESIYGPLDPNKFALVDTAELNDYDEADLGRTLIPATATTAAFLTELNIPTAASLTGTKRGTKYLSFENTQTIYGMLSDLADVIIGSNDLPLTEDSIETLAASFHFSETEQQQFTLSFPGNLSLNLQDMSGKPSKYEKAFLKAVAALQNQGCKVLVRTFSEDSVTEHRVHKSQNMGMISSFAVETVSKKAVATNSHLHFEIEILPRLYFDDRPLDLEKLNKLVKKALIQKLRKKQRLANTTQVLNSANDYAQQQPGIIFARIKKTAASLETKDLVPSSEPRRLLELNTENDANPRKALWVKSGNPKVPIGGYYVAGLADSAAYDIQARQAGFVPSSNEYRPLPATLYGSANQKYDKATFQVVTTNFTLLAASVDATSLFVSSDPDIEYRITDENMIEARVKSGSSKEVGLYQLIEKGKTPFVLRNHKPKPEDSRQLIDPNIPIIKDLATQLDVLKNDRKLSAAEKIKRGLGLVKFSYKDDANIHKRILEMSPDLGNLVANIITQKQGTCTYMGLIQVAIVRYLGYPAKYISGYVSAGNSADIYTSSGHAFLAYYNNDDARWHFVDMYSNISVIPTAFRQSSILSAASEVQVYSPDFELDFSQLMNVSRQELAEEWNAMREKFAGTGEYLSGQYELLRIMALVYFYWYLASLGTKLSEYSAEKLNILEASAEK